MRIVVLTGAGISAESGVPTFRDANGLWEGHDIMEVATPEGYAANPLLVHRFYDARRAALGSVEPNPAHLALAELERSLAERGGEFLLVTQNVDDLHLRAGSERVRQMHGKLRSALCAACDHRHPWDADLSPESYAPDARPICPACDSPELRPDVVWFGELPLHLEEIFDAMEDVDVFVAIGTSGVVQPAAHFVDIASSNGAYTLEINLEETAASDLFDESRYGKASELVPEWVQQVLATL